MDFLLDSNLDLVLNDDKALSLCDKKEQLVKQRVMLVLNTNKGEWEYDISFGTPWLENDYNKDSILGKVPITVFNAEIQKQILSREGVQELLTFNTEFNNLTRSVSVNTSFSTDSGAIVSVITG